MAGSALIALTGAVMSATIEARLEQETPGDENQDEENPGDETSSEETGSGED